MKETKERKTIKSLVQRVILVNYPIDDSKTILENNDVSYWNMNTKIFLDSLERYEKDVTRIDGQLHKLIFNISYFYLMTKKAIFDVYIENVCYKINREKTFYSYISELYVNASKMIKDSTILNNRDYIVITLLPCFLDKLQELIKKSVTVKYTKDDVKELKAQELAFNMYNTDTENITTLIEHVIKNNLFYY